MPDKFETKVYLQTLSDPHVPTRYSVGAQRRAGQLQRFVKDLQAVGREKLGVGDGLELLVVNYPDWRKLFSYPYGWPFTRTKPKGEGVSIVVAADYPPRFVHGFDETLLRAGQAGVKAPGDVREFLDMLVGHEWGHAAANLSGLRSKVKWFDEFMATYLYLATLKEMGADGIYDRFLAWAELEVAGSAVTRADLVAFEYPRAKLKLDNLLWFQGVFTLKAAEVLSRRGWDFPEAMRGGKRHRGAVARTLMEVEPSFREWFTVFAQGDEDGDEGDDLFKPAAD